MPRGRQFTPDSTKEGHWFKHHVGDGLIENTSLIRAQATTTEEMTTAPFSSKRNFYPWNPPPSFHLRSSPSSMARNSFSEHDNRHRIQDAGEYFADGQSGRTLGKRIGQVQRQHFTRKGYLKHDGSAVCEYDYSTNYDRTYSAPPARPESSHRRFSRSRPPSSGAGALQQEPHSTALWSRANPSHVSAKHAVGHVSTRVLALSQVPFAQETGQWKYSNHGSNRLYPPQAVKRATTMI